MPRLTKVPTLAKLAVAALEDVKGQEIKVLDVMKLTTITDTMIICTGTSSRHVKSLADSVIKSAKESGNRPSGIEGLDMGEWVLVDLGSVVVHVMQAQARAFYQLEKLWDVAPVEYGPTPQPPKPRKAKSGKGGKAKAAKSKAGKSSLKSNNKSAYAKPRKNATVGKPAAKKPVAKKYAGKKTAAKKKPAR
ncbi:MAG: ribosome silencing factor [Stenotrophobium sp.]